MASSASFKSPPLLLQALLPVSPCTWLGAEGRVEGLYPIAVLQTVSPRPRLLLLPPPADDSATPLLNHTSFRAPLAEALSQPSRAP